jgi:glycosyltransferase involved in cell wall biosynthesis
MNSTPLVSAVIIFLNAEKFIEEAIKSVFAQTYDNWELLLVDDGSTDSSTQIAKNYAQFHPQKARYLEHYGHENRGKSASRNVGIAHASGEYIAFLDADDVWLPAKLEKQVAIMEQYPEVGLMINPAFYWDTDGNQHPQPMTLSNGHIPTGEWLPKMLESHDNAACPTAVLMRKELALKVGGFEETFQPPLRVMEDQVMWFKVTLNSPLYYHPECVALWRIHPESSCFSDPLTQKILERVATYSWLVKYLEQCGVHHYRMKFIKMTQRKLFETLLVLINQPEDENRSPVTRHRLYRFNRGLKLASYYRHSLGLALSALLPINAVSSRVGPSTDIFAFSRKGNNKVWFRALKSFPRYLAKNIRTILLEPTKVSVTRVTRLINMLKARVRLTAGIQPLSQFWGSDRGLPTHRYYLEQFMQEFASNIRGHCLEFQDDAYTTRFGSSAVTKLDIIHVDDSNPDATVIADLTKPNDIPSNFFDCIICTHTLHVIFELDKAVSELHRILKPGGVLLVAVPHVSMCDPGWHEVWRFTPEGLHLVLAKTFGKENVTIRAYGNSLIAAGQIRGVVSHEFTKAELDYHDPRFAVEVCARALKLPDKS